MLKYKRKGAKISYEGHTYNFEKLSVDGTKAFWRCDKRIADGCYARIHTFAESGNFIQQIRSHTHGSDAAGVAASKVFKKPFILHI